MGRLYPVRLDAKLRSVQTGLLRAAIWGRPPPRASTSSLGCRRSAAVRRANSHAAFRQEQGLGEAGRTEGEETNSHLTITQQKKASISPDEAKAIAQEAGLGMPLVYIEIQMDTTTHVSKVDPGHAPINQFVHYRAFPDASNGRGRLQRRHAVLAGAAGSVEGTDGPFGAGHGEPVLGDADDRRVEQRAACAGLAHGRQQGRSLRDRGPTWKGTLPQGLTELRVPTNLALVGGRSIPAVLTTTPRSMRCKTSRSWCPFRHGASRTRRRTTCPSKRAWMQDAGAETSAGAVARRILQPPQSPAGDKPARTGDPKTMARLATLGIAPGATFRMDAFTPRCARRLRPASPTGSR